MDRTQHLALAAEAIDLATDLAHAAQRHAKTSARENAHACAAAVTAWTNVAAAHTALAALLPTTPKD
ncbi:hypothetical protein [Streptomyces sp. 049-1]|uniref:hypothetical protein n=1 Tax=Streptomyces sp. 049-1 TaxID=2789264 RepID=UPI0039801724